MSQPVLQASPYRAARLVHFGLVLGVVMIVLVFAIVRPALGIEAMDQLTTVLRIVAVLLLFASVVVMRLARSRIEPIRSRDDREAWWLASLPKAIVVWALADGTATAGAVFWLLTGDYVILAVVTGVALALLVMHRPAVLEEA
jgi:hypothetical protein